jgi:hypothetical protein
MNPNLARTTDLGKFSVLVTCHETSQNYLDFTDISNTDWPALRAWLSAKDPDGTWVSDSLFSGPVYFYTVITGFGPAVVTVTDHSHYQFTS